MASYRKAAILLTLGAALTAAIGAGVAAHQSQSSRGMIGIAAVLPIKAGSMYNSRMGARDLFPVAMRSLPLDIERSSLELMRGIGQ